MFVCLCVCVCLYLYVCMCVCVYRLTRLLIEYGMQFLPMKEECVITPVGGEYHGMSSVYVYVCVCVCVC